VNWLDFIRTMWPLILLLLGPLAGVLAYVLWDKQL